MTCRYDRDTDDYLTPDGHPCRTDDYGDPTHHCTARRTCPVHIAPDELTCPRCLARTRADITAIRDLAALMPTEALHAGVHSEAANLAGPACDPEAWTWRKITARRGGPWHASLVEDDDEQHPALALGRWALMVAEAYTHALPPRDTPLTVTWCAAYLDRQLARLAHDPEQDFAQMARELRACRAHLESVLHDSRTPERGAPCPDCTTDDHGVGPRLVRRYGHWCEDPDCARLHYADDAADHWVCPRNRDHRWDHETYTRWIDERRSWARRTRRPTG